MLVRTEGYEHLPIVDDFKSLKKADRALMRVRGKSLGFPTNANTVFGLPQYPISGEVKQKSFEIVALSNIVSFGGRLFYDIDNRSVPISSFRKGAAIRPSIEIPEIKSDTPFIAGITYSIDISHRGHGHLLLEAFSQLWAANLCNPRRILTNKHTKKYFSPAITPFTQTRLKCYGEPVILEKVIFATPSYGVGRYISNHYVDLCRSVTSHYNVEEAKTSKLLYVSRRFGTKRRLINELDIEDAFSKAGFRVIHPETMPFEDQIKAFVAADVVAGPIGSALYNSVFSKLGTKRIILAPSSFYTKNDLLIGAITGSAPIYVFADTPLQTPQEGMMHDWHLPLDGVRAALNAIGLY